MKERSLEVRAGLSVLSERENQVFRLLLADKQNKEIATELCISIRTVKFHVENILKKLRCSTRYEVQRHFRPPRFDEVLVIADLIARVNRIEQILGER
jgi:DNA-binding CsgD family transcriptional regulator